MKITKRQLRRIIAERFTPDDFKDVYNTARMAHVGQTRRDGSEYFSHPSEVRNIARRFYPRDNVVQMAALLHDSLEDAPGSTVSSVEEMEEFIRGSIQDPSSAGEVIRVVRSLTHEKGGNYTDYVVGLLGDIPTLRVKLADMVHNLSDNPKPKQKVKYRSALNAIGDRTSGRAPAGISSQHWEELLSLTEGTKMKITKRQLRRIIKEAVYDQMSYDLGLSTEEGLRTPLAKLLAIVARSEPAGFEPRSREEKDMMLGLKEKGLVNYGLDPRGGYRGHITDLGRRGLQSI